MTPRCPCGSPAAANDMDLCRICWLAFVAVLGERAKARVN